MARQNHGPLSRAKGKLGGVVYQQYEGMQISREYQPNVKNPQSEKQVNNRADFKLASQTVALYQEVINARLSKLSIYTRMRRGAALEAVKRIATSGSNNDRVIMFTSAMAAINAKSLTEFAAPITTEAGGIVSVTAPATAVILGVIAGFDANGQLVGRKVVSATSSGPAYTFVIPSEYVSAKAAFVYTIATTEDGRAIYENITNAGTDISLAIVRLIASGDADISDIASISVGA